NGFVASRRACPGRSPPFLLLPRGEPAMLLGLLGSSNPLIMLGQCLVGRRVARIVAQGRMQAVQALVNKATTKKDGAQRGLQGRVAGFLGHAYVGNLIDSSQVGLQSPELLLLL